MTFPFFFAIFVEKMWVRRHVSCNLAGLNVCQKTTGTSLLRRHSWGFVTRGGTRDEALRVSAWEARQGQKDFNFASYVLL